MLSASYLSCMKPTGQVFCFRKQQHSWVQSTRPSCWSGLGPRHCLPSLTPAVVTLGIWSHITIVSDKLVTSSSHNGQRSKHSAARSKQPTLPAAADGTLPGWAGRASAVSPQLHSWQPSPGLCNYMALSLCKCFTQHRRGHQFWQWYCESWPTHFPELSYFKNLCRMYI